MSFTLSLAEVLDFFQPLKYSNDNNVFKIRVKRSFLILSKERALSFFFFFAIALDEKALAFSKGVRGNIQDCTLLAWETVY
ncbi:MAG: hypothetical protein O4753_01000 [Trichodesmium sp. St7_bin2_1]|nr:hypothetical protein [Trichodesmium sp. St7_bin2_1]